MKKLKYIFIALAVIVLCIGGYIVYELKFKSYDTADPEVDALIEETYNVELPDGTVIVVDKEGNIVENKTLDSQNNGVTTASAQTSSTNENSDSTQDDEKGTETGTTNNGNSSSNSNSGQTGTSASSNSSSNTGTTGSNSNANPSTNTNTGGSNQPAEKVTVASIKSKYEGTFKSLENQSRARINSLISQAANEYSTKKSNGESISYGYFYKKYMGAANGIESATDSTVNVVVGLVEKDLQKNGFDKSYAQSFKEDYNAMKESLRSEMMDKALSFR
ncbi:hypothetical protein [Solibacillus isronensis]|uniref:hypothetical protein n=1 Tax=Solibacillus isronensis TaxID=412383 RepID=UPI0020414782|nr:hypothetical protein [Solibacillus isronensis]MCM3722118.1 hypothetical protein [Solibacillus isronensis]